MGFVRKLQREFSFFSGNYSILIISSILIDFARELPGTYYSDYVLQLGGTPSILGLITFVSMLALASVQFPGGYLADKYGRGWLVSTLTYSVAISYIFHLAAPSWHFILVGEFLRSLCFLNEPALGAMFADSLPAEKRGIGFSIMNLIMSVSTTPAPVVALFLVTAYGSLTGMRISYFIVMILLLAAATVRLKLKENLRNTERLNLKEAFCSYPTALKEGLSVWKNVPRSTFFLLVSSLILSFSFVMTMSLNLVYAFYVLQIGGTPNPMLLPEQDPALQLARERWGYVNTALFITMMILSIPVGKMIDRVGRKTPLILMGILMVPASLLFVYGNYPTLFVSMIVLGLAALLGFSAYQALIADLVPQAQRGKVMGSMGFFTYLFMAIGGAVGGLLYDNVSPQLPFLLMPVLIVPATLLIVFYVREPAPEERQA